MKTLKTLIFSFNPVLRLIFGVAFIFMLLAVYFALKQPNTHKDTVQYPFLAGRLFGRETDDIIINFTQLREVMKSRFEEKKIPLGVYFEYLPTGSSIGVNDQLLVEIGSLTKVPLVTAAYQNIEKGNLSLDQKLTIQEKHLDTLFGELYKRGAGTTLSAEEAIEYTLIQSDNTAANVLLDALPEDALAAVFDEFDLPKIRTGPFPVLSPKSYSSVLRALYLSALLSPENSNHILELLSKTEFKDKLPAGVAPNVVIAHKIGVFRVDGASNVHSDCGIIYIPQRPYILCIMVAADEDIARAEISAYSKMVYSFVAQVRNSK